MADKIVMPWGVFKKICVFSMKWLDRSDKCRHMGNDTKRCRYRKSCPFWKHFVKEEES
jgi:hypothetical protein